MEIEILDNSTIINSITVIIAIISLLVSVVSYRDNSKNNKRNIKYSKLEELLEILNYASLPYGSLRQCYRTMCDMEDSKNFPTSDDVFRNYTNALNLQKRHATTLIESKEKYYDKLGKAEILSKCYIDSEELNLQILCLIELLTGLALVVYGDTSIENSSVGRTPSYMKIIKLVYRFEIDIIKEMGLKTKIPTRKKINDYRDNKFFNELK